MKRIVLGAFLLSSLLWFSCTENTKPVSKHAGPYNPEVGIGRFEVMTLPTALNKSMAKEGERIYKSKCQACHKLDATKTIGPGWKGITGNRSPAWIMNYLTNTDEMIDIDPELQKMIASGAPRMPDQDLKDSEARAILEFMRQNDGVN